MWSCWDLFGIEMGTGEYISTQIHWMVHLCIHKTALEQASPSVHMHTFAKREDLPASKRITFIVLIPVLVLLSGLFAGLTLGYMSLDETQLHVLSISGTP